MKDIEQIYTEYFNTICKYLFCLIHNEDIAEELTQETFYKAIQKINTFKNNCKKFLCSYVKFLKICVTMN